MAAILTFYRNFAWLASFISLFGCYLTAASGTWTFVAVVFWVKIVTNVFLGLFIHVFHPGQYNFFYHLGFDKLQLYLFTFLLDMAIWIALSLLTITLFL